MNKEERWQPKPGEYVRHKLKPEVKMLVTGYWKVTGWPCRWLKNGELADGSFEGFELEQWEEEA